MDRHHFDHLARALAVGFPRRRLPGLLAACAIGPGTMAEVPFGALARKKRKDKGNRRGKGNKKKCKAGQRPCNGGCIPATDCCNGDTCDTCALEICENGLCGCTGGRVRQQGVCGFVPDCKSLGLTCANDDECCSRSCSIFDGVSYRCAKSTDRCIVDLDCLSGACRGFMCPELYNIATGGVC